MTLQFNLEYFQKFEYKQSTIKQYLESAYKDLKIAKEAKVPDVIFQFSYNAFIKLGITLIAVHGHKVSARMGHHIKIIDSIAKILKEKNISVHGNSMRKTRNIELYNGGVLVTKKEARAYLKFVNKLFVQSEKVLKDYFGSLF